MAKTINPFGLFPDVVLIKVENTVRYFHFCANGKIISKLPGFESYPTTKIFVNKRDINVENDMRWCKQTLELYSKLGDLVSQPWDGGMFDDICINSKTVGDHMIFRIATYFISIVDDAVLEGVNFAPRMPVVVSDTVPDLGHVLDLLEQKYGLDISIARSELGHSLLVHAVRANAPIETVEHLILVRHIDPNTKDNLGLNCLWYVYPVILCNHKNLKRAAVVYNDLQTVNNSYPQALRRGIISKLLDHGADYMSRLDHHLPYLEALDSCSSHVSKEEQGMCKIAKISNGIMQLLHNHDYPIIISLINAENAELIAIIIDKAKMSYNDLDKHAKEYVDIIQSGGPRDRICFILKIR